MSIFFFHEISLMTPFSKNICINLYYIVFHVKIKYLKSHMGLFLSEALDIAGFSRHNRIRLHNPEFAERSGVVW